MAIDRWDPFGEMMSLREAMNRLFEESFVRPSLTATSGWGRMDLPIDLRETDDQFILEAAMPGVRPEDIDVSVQGNQLRIQGEVRKEEERKGERYHYRERHAGRFQRMITLPSSINPDQVSCELRNGVLTVTMPKAEEARPRRIQIIGGDQPRQIEGQAREVGQRS